MQHPKVTGTDSNTGSKAGIKADPKATTNSATKVGTKADPKATTNSATKAGIKADPKATTNSATKAGTKADPKATTNSATKAGTKARTKAGSSKKSKGCCSCCPCCKRQTDDDEIPFHKIWPPKPRRLPVAPKITRRVSLVEYIKQRPKSGKKNKLYRGSNTTPKIFVSKTKLAPIKKSRLKLAPKISRREQFVEYKRWHPSKGNKEKKKKEQNVSKSRENETEVYYCTINPLSFISNSRKLQPSLIPAVNATGKNETEGLKDSNKLRPKATSSKEAGILSKRDNYTPKTAFCRKPAVARHLHDFACQSNLQSNQSIELKSQVLSKSVSQVTSVQSVFSIKWRRRFQKHEKKPSVIQSILFSLARKFKGAITAQKHEKRNVLVLHVPKSCSNTTTGSATRNTPQVEKTVFIRDESSETLNTEHPEQLNADNESSCETK